MIKLRLALGLFPVILFACSNNNLSSKNSNTISLNDSVPSKTALETVSNFSKTFKPDSSAYKGIGTLKNVPDSVAKAFKILRQTDTLSHKKYLTVIFLKLYLDHLRCCHQSYEIREKMNGSIDSVADPLLYEFNLATKMFDLNKYHEFINSGIADTYVEKHQELLAFPEIREVINQIRPVSDSIAKHLYWKD